MPIYEYRCENGHTFEVLQRMSDDRISVCETCDAPVQQVFHPIAVHFKGSGFYNTDYGTKNRSKETEAAAKKESADKSADKSREKKKSGETPASSTSGGDKSGETPSKNAKAGSTSSKSKSE